MSTRAEYQSTTYRSEPYSRSASSYQDSTPGVTQAVTSMMTAPFWMTAAGINWLTSSMQRIGDSMSAGNSSSMSSGSSNGSWNGGSQQSLTSAGSGHPSASSDRSSWSEWANPANWTGSKSGGSTGSGDQDLSGDDLKYVNWTIVFTKPGYEAVLESTQCDLVAYSTDSSSYAAMKIAKFLERARFGKATKPHGWVEHDYPSEPHVASRRTEAKTEKHDGSKQEVKAESKQETGKSEREQNGWRIPSDDQKYVQFLYKIEWRLPKQKEESTRVERVTVERTTNAHANIVV